MTTVDSQKISFEGVQDDCRIGVEYNRVEMLYALFFMVDQKQ